MHESVFYIIYFPLKYNINYIKIKNFSINKKGAYKFFKKSPHTGDTKKFNNGKIMAKKIFNGTN